MSSDAVLERSKAPRANGPEARQAMYVQTIPPEWRVFAAWPVPARTTVREKYRSRFDSLCKAASLFLQLQPMADVLEAAKIGERQFYLLLSRALETRRLGETIEGARAFSYATVQARRQRTAELKRFAEPHVGFCGAFGKLLEDYPKLLAKLESYLEGLERPNTITPTLLHAKFLQFAKEEGIAESRYPFHTESRGKKPLTRWFKEVWIPAHAIRHIRRERGPDAATAAQHSLGDGTRKVSHPPFEAWVIDAVKVDLHCGIQVPSTRFGVEHVRVGRIQGLLVRSMAPICLNLAWHLCLSAKPTADDVLLVLRNAIISRALGVAPEREWALKEGACFPAYVIEALKYAPPLHLYLDNALEHLADKVQQMLTQIGGGIVYCGKPAMPKSRPEIEAAFSRYLVDFVHQLPGATGTGPGDPLRQAADVPPERSVPYWLLDEASQAYFGNENVTPSSSAGYLDAMTRLRDLVAGGGLRLNQMPEGRRSSYHFTLPQRVYIKCDLRSKTSRLPYVYFNYRRYSSPWLKEQPHLRGKAFWVRHDPEDLSHVWLMDDMDTRVDTLQCEGEWGMFAHSMQVLKVYARYKHLGMKGPRAYEATIAMVLEYMVKVAPTDTSAARDLAYLIAYFKRMLPPQAFADIGVEAAANQWRGIQHAASIHVGPLVPPKPPLGVPPAPISQPGAPVAHRSGRPVMPAFAIPRSFR